MYLSRFNYISDCERNGQRILMNFLSRSCDIIDEKSVAYFFEKKGHISPDEKKYAAERGYLFSSKEEEATILQEWHSYELQNSKKCSVIHLDTFDGDYIKALEKVQPTEGLLTLYSETLDKTVDCIGSLPKTQVITTGESLQYFEPLFRNQVVSQVSLIVPLSGNIPFEKDTESILDTLIEHGVLVEIIGRLQENNCTRLKSLMNYFIYKGWPFLENFTCNVEPENNKGCIFGYWYGTSGLPRKIFQEYTAFPQTEFCSTENWVGINPVHSLIWTGKPSVPSFHFCEASTGLTVYTGEGPVPCFKCAGRSDTAYWETCTPYIKECRHCVYEILCGGGCRLQKERCPPVKELIEISLEYYFDEFLERLRFYEQYGGIQ
ncbi:MAG: hypothetical protein PVF58_21165 [Candidatus Methanofastidiosia archaeon]|jgi:hypothetical protein